jgi:hypothetical protein
LEPHRPKPNPPGSLSALRDAVRRFQTGFESRLRAYVKKRGFESLHDRAFFVRAFLTCWAEPGFHRFWRVWNPGISYFVHRLYVRLRPSLGRDEATVVAFVANGVVHTAVVAPLLGRWSWTLPVAFLFFGAFTVASRRLEGPLRQSAWPWPLNACVNVALVCLSMDLGFRFDAWWNVG